MKKKNLFAALGLVSMGLTSVQAQVAKLGFEDGDEMYHHKDSAAFASFYGDHINLDKADQWDEKYTTDVHAGQYALRAFNCDTVQGQTWLRGFKMRNLNIEPETSYRVSFWIKANPTYVYTNPADNSTKEDSTQVKASLSIGRENFEAPFLSPSGKEYWYNYYGKMTGEWRRFSFVSYFPTMEVMNQYLSKYNGNIKDIIINDPNDPSKNDTIWYAKDETSFPNEYFLTLNMYNPGEYLLDDILIEKATMAGCTYNYNTIRVDLGYPTNIDSLAQADINTPGTICLPNEWAQVTQNGEPLEILGVEGKSDGYLYIFTVNDIEDAEGISVKFTPGADCPIEYNTDKRPSLSTEKMTVLPFEGEAIYLDEGIETLPSAWEAPKFEKSIPANDSYELTAADVKTIQFVYNKPLSVEYVTARLAKVAGDEVVEFIKDGFTLSEDGCTLNVPISTTLADGYYKLEVTDVENEHGQVAENQTIMFEVGEDKDTTIPEVVHDWNQEFATTANGTFPVGWRSNDNGTIHEYGLTDKGEVINYNWGGNTGGGGCRMMTGYTGDVNGGMIYWRATGGGLGTLTFGEQVKDKMGGDGSIPDDLDPAIALKLEAKRHQITFKCAAWKYFDDGSAPKFNFSLEDLNGVVIAHFDNVEAKPNVNGQQNVAVNGVTVCTTAFNVPEAGYYVLKFYCQSEGGFHEFVMGGATLRTMPSNAAYGKLLIKEATDSAQVVLTAVEDVVYDGETKTALQNAVNEALAKKFTNLADVDAVCADIYAQCGKMIARQTNLDNYYTNFDNAKTAIDGMTGTKYEGLPIYSEILPTIEKYTDVAPESLSDEELADVVAIVTNPEITGAKSTADVLSKRIYYGTKTAAKLGCTNQALIDECNNALTDDDALAAAINNELKLDLYKFLGEGNTITAEMQDSVISETEYEEDGVTFKTTAKGIDMTSFIKNPNIYTFDQTNDVEFGDDKTPGWNLVAGATGYSDAANMANQGTNVGKLAVEKRFEIWKGEYEVNQVIKGLPVGYYTVYMRTRNAIGANGINDVTGLPDRFLYAKVNEGDTLFTAYPEKNQYYQGLPTAVYNVKIEEGDSLTMGVRQLYTSGKNTEIQSDSQGNDSIADKGNWETTTYVHDPRLYFVAPLEGYDYKQAYITDVTDAPAAALPVKKEIFTLDGRKLNAYVRGINIVKTTFENGKVVTKKVLVK